MVCAKLRDRVVLRDSMVVSSRNRFKECAVNRWAGAMIMFRQRLPRGGAMRRVEWSFDGMSCKL